MVIAIKGDHKRITPAYTGKRYNLLLHWSRKEDHPRIHGEKICAMRVSSDFVGSPPHTRGKGTRDAVWFYVRGITPAYTGKRQFTIFNIPIIKDHPRIHGEKK